MWSQKRDMPQAPAPEPKNLPTPNKKSADVTRVLDPTAERATGRLGSGLRVKGEISGTEDLLIEGPVEGRIQLDGRKLTVGTEAKLIADINAREVLVYGYVKGNIHATEKIDIKNGGSVNGNLTTAQIMIEDGADFKGTIEIDRSATKETDKNASVRAASAAAGAGPKNT
jgi:cytoskeletal protein CcmA (bactofilin family)